MIYLVQRRFIFLSTLALMGVAFYAKNLVFVKKDHFFNYSLRTTDGWFELSGESKLQRFGKLSPFVRRIIALPYEGSSERIVLMLVHGTFGQETPGYYDDDSQDFKNIKKFAKKLSLHHKRSVEIVSFKWSGAHGKRYQRWAARALSELINNHFSDHDGTTRIMTVGHCHGANVVNKATHLLRDGIAIDTMVNLAAPIRVDDSKATKPKKGAFSKLYNLYSKTDWIQVIACTMTHNPLKYLASIAWNVIRSKTHKIYVAGCESVYNMRVKVAGKHPGHSSIRGIFSDLFDIIHRS